LDTESMQEGWHFATEAEIEALKRRHTGLLKA
jgi:hypothetical protein